MVVGSKQKWIKHYLPMRLLLPWGLSLVHRIQQLVESAAGIGAGGRTGLTFYFRLNTQADAAEDRATGK